MANMRFVGNNGEIHSEVPMKFTRFGQVAAIPDALVANIVLDQQFPVVTEDWWVKYNFTDDELKKYWNVNMHNLATPEFVAKRNKLWSEMTAFRESYQKQVTDLANQAAAPAPVLAADPTKEVK